MQEHVINSTMQSLDLAPLEDIDLAELGGDAFRRIIAPSTCPDTTFDVQTRREARPERDVTHYDLLLYEALDQGRGVDLFVTTMSELPMHCRAPGVELTRREERRSVGLPAGEAFNLQPLEAWDYLWHRDPLLTHRMAQLPVGRLSPCVNLTGGTDGPQVPPIA